ncbi:MAG: hypothetical protein AAFN81_07015 [Bacteroidota bacterium]
MYRLLLLALCLVCSCQSSENTMTEEEAEVAKEELIYIASRGEGFDLYTFDLENQTESQYTKALGWEWGPQFIAAEKVIVYNSQDTVGNFQLRAADLRGDSVSFSLPDLPDLKVSPNGEWILFTRKDGDVSQLKLASRENPADSLLITPAAAYHGRAKWNANSDQIAFISDQSGSNEVFCYQLSNKQTQRLTTNSLREKYLSWSPDGRSLASTIRGDRTENDIVIIKLQDLSLERLTDTPINESEIAWSPSGRYIAYHAKVDEKDDIFLLEIETGKVEKITTGNGYHGEPEWILAE